MKKGSFLHFRNLLSITLVSIVLLSGCTNPLYKTQDGNNANLAKAAVVDTKDNYVAKVADEKVLQSEFYFYLNQVKKSMEQSASQNGNTKMESFWTTKIDGKDPKEVAAQNALSKIQEYKIALINAKSNKLELTEKEKTEVLNSLNDMITQNGGESAVSENLKNELGITLEQYKSIFNNFQLINKYMNAKKEEQTVTDSEILSYYNSNKTKFDTVTVVHVLFSIVDPNTQQPLSKEKQDQAKKNADDTLAKVKAGEDIKELAKKYSEDPGLTQNGGVYEVKKNGEMIKEFEDWSFSKKVGDVGIVKTDFGYHVMKKIKETTFNDLKSDVKSEIQMNRISDLLKQMSKEPKYKVVINDKVYKNLKL